MEITTLPIGELTPYENNARRHEDDDVSAIMASIKEFGFSDPIGIWGEKNVIVEGHGRLMAAKKLKLKEVPCIRLDHLTDEQRRAYALAHNQTAALSSWDIDLLGSELDSILDIDMSSFGFDLSSFDEEPEAQEDDYEVELPEEPKSKLGDIYQLGRHRLMCGDATDIDTVMALMDGKQADMVFTDPPYNVSYASKNEFLNQADNGNHIQDDIENDSLGDDEQAKDNLWMPAFQNARQVAADDCSVYITMPQGSAHMRMMLGANEAGWQVKHELIWLKNNHVLGRSDYNYKHEPILYGWNKKHTFYGNGKFKTSIWEIPKPQKSDLHPTMKPIELIAECLMNSTKEDDNVLDVFGGSGTTIITCEQLNRNCFMLELDPRYVDVIIDRWETFTGEKAVLLNG